MICRGSRMFSTIGKVLKYRRQTQEYPKKAINSELFIGKPEIDSSKCTKCCECLKHCPSNAIVQDPLTGEIGINVDECIFCVHCEDVCQFNAIHMTNEFEMAVKDLSLIHISEPTRRTPISYA